MSEQNRRFHPLLVGALCGVALAVLLLGLNTDLITPLAILRLLSVAAATGLAASLPFAFLLPAADRPSRLLWFALTLFLGTYAAFAEEQRLLHYIFLPNGTRRVLVAGAVAASLGALLGLAALVARPSNRSSSCLLAAVLALFLLAPLAGRRVDERGALASPPQLPRAAQRSVLVVGLEGASWNLVSQGASEGSLPVLARLLKEGAAGPLASLEPYDRAALWTTAGTGKKPVRHGVVSSGVFETPAGALRILPRLPGTSPFRSIPFGRYRPSPAPRRSLFFWEILAMRGHEAAVLDWPAAVPARDGLVLWAAEAMFRGDTSDDAARPPEAAARARLFRVSPGNLDRFLVRSLQPDGLPEADRVRASLLAAAAEDLTVAGAALGAVPTGPGSALTLVLSGLARAAGPFGPAAESNRYWGLSPRSAEARATALEAYYKFLDDILSDLLSREGRDRTICVFSPTTWGPPPPLTAVARFLSGREPEADPEAARDGFVILHGSGIRAGVRLTSASVLDLAPTLLVLAGEPIARDIDGRVLAEAFDERFSQSASIPIVTTFEPKGPQ